jgi:hypothetical protein
MANRNYFKPGAHYNVICDSCGFKFKDNELRQRWDGFMVCKPCWTPRQPQDFLRARTENLQLPYSRPRPADQFIQFYTVNLTDTVTGVDNVGVSKSIIPVDSSTGTDSISFIVDSGFAVNGYTLNSKTLG